MTISDLKTPKDDEGTSRHGDVFTSYSLNFEDVILRRLFPDTSTGFYVDVGAGHPRFENDLFSFYQRGWHGINVEPNRGFHAKLVEERPRDTNLQVLLSDTAGGALTFYEIDESGLSTCDLEQATAYETSGRYVSSRQVPVTTLFNVLTESRVDHIQILKVDVEGFEEKVLNGNDWDRFRPDVVVVEATYPESPVRRPTTILSFLEQHGYRHAHFDGLNDFYLEQQFPIPEGFTLPPNVFDHFVPREIADLRSQAESLRSQAESLRSQAESLRSQAESLRSNFTAAQNYAVSLRGETAHLTSENQRLRKATEQMRAELLILNQYMEQLHAASERLELYQRKLSTAEKKLASVYSSLCWRLTAPLRWCDHFQRRITGRLGK